MVSGIGEKSGFERGREMWTVVLREMCWTSKRGLELLGMWGHEIRECAQRKRSPRITGIVERVQGMVYFYVIAEICLFFPMCYRLGQDIQWINGILIDCWLGLLSW